MPTCAAVIVQTPLPIRVTVDPLTSQTEGVLVVNVTVSPDDAAAFKVTGDWARLLLANPPKVIDWPAFDTMKLCVTVAAGLYVAFPA